MKAKTLWQPWATLIAEGFKTIETRSQPPPHFLMGHRIAIHAGKRPVRIREWSYAMRYAMYHDSEDSRLPSDWPYGVVVATARLACAHKVEWTSGDMVQLRPGAQPCLTDCAHYLRAGYNETIDPFGDFSPGRWLWFLRDVEKVVPPAPAKGSQGWWEWKEER